MQAILLVTVFSCLLAAASAADVALEATCIVTDECADANAICATTLSKCICRIGYTAYSGVCVISNGTVGGGCLSSSPACTDDNLVCESSVCKIKAGAACFASSPDCVSQSTCSNDRCTCDAGYTVTPTGLCSRCLTGPSVGVSQPVSSGQRGGSIISLLLNISTP